ncbi:MAG: hypothetical protein JXB05_27880 [Myxococcaceae bacterium]|nr:hypothetical protein [Myxococcaceae bacterium]
MRMMFSKVFGSVALTLGLAMAGCGAPEASTPEGTQLPATQKAELRIVTPDAQKMSEEARAALLKAIQARPDMTGSVSLISLRQEGSWALGTLTWADLSKPLALGDESHLTMDNMTAVLLVQTEQGWVAAINGDEHLRSLLALVPESSLEPVARAAMFPREGERQQALSAFYNGYKFFWPANVPFRITQGWHDPYTWNGQFGAYMGIDFDVSNASNSDILAGAPGTVTYVCNDGTQMLLTITTSGTSEKVGYLHLDTASVNAAGIGQGSVVNFGTKLGRMLNSDGGTISTSCGTSMGTHVHMYLPYRGVVIDGKTFDTNNLPTGQDLYSSQGTPPPPSNEVIVDNTSSRFTKYGPSQYWYTGNVGYGGSTTYTYANGSTQSNYARWTPALLGAGYYTVYAYIPSNYATSQTAKYRIYHNGTNNYATVNQNNYYNAWVSLGQHYFSSNGTEYVELSDATGEAASLYRMVGFDAIKFVK